MYTLYTTSCTFARGFYKKVLVILKNLKKCTLWKVRKREIDFMQDMRGSTPAPRTKGPRKALRGNPASEGGAFPPSDTAHP